MAHFRLCRSRHFFVVAYPRESTEMVLDAHNRAVAFFGGSCRRGIYDNMPTAVGQVLPGKARVFNRRFAQLCSHYLVEPVACMSGSGLEKGQVERQVKSVREWLFTPRPRVQGVLRSSTPGLPISAERLARNGLIPRKKNGRSGRCSRKSSQPDGGVMVFRSELLRRGGRMRCGIFNHMDVA